LGNDKSRNIRDIFVQPFFGYRTLIEKTDVEQRECRVLHVVSNLGVGGAETWLLALLKFYKEQGSHFPVRVNTHIFLTSGMKSELDIEAENLGATLHYAKYSRTTLPSFIKAWRGVLRQYDFHAIHDHQENTAGLHFAMGLGYLPSVRIAHVHNPVLHIKNYSSTILRRATVWLGRNLISKLATHLAGTSEQLIWEQGFRDTKFDKLVVEPLYCGFDTHRFDGRHEEEFASLCKEFGWPKSSKILLFVGRLDSRTDGGLNQKNPAFAIEVARLCARRDRSFRLLMVGGGDAERRMIEGQVREWGLERQIRLTGQRPDVPRLMLGSHLFLLTSIAEGLGMVVVEAQAAGLQCVVSDATPEECSVETSMVHFLPLADNADTWASYVMDMLAQSRPTSTEGNLAVKNSGFSIDNSATKALKFYARDLCEM
jgi:glycosyltransferase involved in cell wall biosynthesis